MAIELQWDIPVPEGLEDLEAFLGRVADACFKTEGIEGAGFAIRIVDDAAIRSPGSWAISPPIRPFT